MRISTCAYTRDVIDAGDVALQVSRLKRDSSICCDARYGRCETMDIFGQTYG